MKQILEYLEQLEFSKTEAELYISLLECGPLSVAELAERVKLNRTAAYTHIYSLLEKGMIAEVMIGSRKQLVATDPERLGYLIEKKQESLKAMQNKLPDILTTINSSFAKNKSEEKADVKSYKGINSVKAIYNEALMSNEFRSYVEVGEPPVLSPDNITFFNNAFKKNKQIKMWEIVYDSPFSRRQAMKVLAQNNNRYFYKFMPSNLKWTTSEDVLIYDGKVVIVNYTGNVSSIVLQSTDFYNNLKELFDFMWRMLPEPK